MSFPHLREVQALRFEVAGIPAHNAQKSWAYSLHEDKDGRYFRISDGRRAFGFRPGDKSEDGTLNLDRLPDVGDEELRNGDKPLSKGLLQVHRSTPGQIYGTLQTGRNNVTFQLQEQEGKWKLIPGKQRLNRAQAVAAFVRGVGDKTASMPSFFAKLVKKTAPTVMPVARDIGNAIRRPFQSDPTPAQSGAAPAPVAPAAKPTPPATPPSIPKTGGCACPKCNQDQLTQDLKGGMRCSYCGTNFKKEDPYEKQAADLNKLRKLINRRDPDRQSSNEWDQHIWEILDEADAHKTAKKFEPSIAVDLDGTLAWAPDESFLKKPGKPIKPMMEAVRKWIAEGKTVKILTARAHDPSQIRIVKNWLKQHGLPNLTVTNQKDPGMQVIIDDKAVGIDMNKGTVHGQEKSHEKLSKVAAAMGVRRRRRGAAAESPNWTAPLTLGMGLGGLGLFHAANKMLTPRDEALLKQAPGFVDEIISVDNPTAKMNNYVEYLGNAARAKIWGGTVKDWMKKIRSTPFTPEQSRWNESSPRHYEVFAAGPLTAHREMVPETYGALEPLPGTLEPGDLLKRYDKAVGQVANSLGLPAEYDKMDVNHQKQIFGALRPHIQVSDPRLEEALVNTEAARAKDITRHAPTYARIADTAVGVRDTMRWVGLGAGLLGTGLFGVWLYQKIKQKREQSAAAAAGKRYRPKPQETSLPIGPGMTVKMGSKIASIRAALLRDVRAAEEATLKEPSQSQMEAGNYKKGKVWINGLHIAIESPSGSIRSGTSRSGQSWSTTMKHPYGYILNFAKSEADGDHVDCFVGPHPESEVVFVIDQQINDKFDECKVMIGWTNSEDAKQAYHDNYSKGWKGFMNITPLTMTQFKAWLEKGDTGKPMAGQKLKKIADSFYDRADAWHPKRKEFVLVDVPKLIDRTQGRPSKVVQLSKIWGGSMTSPGFSEDRVAKADPQYPILVDGYSEDPKQPYGLVDGRHRRIKMLREGIEKGRVIKITPQDIEAAEVQKTAMPDPTTVRNALMYPLNATNPWKGIAAGAGMGAVAGAGLYGIGKLKRWFTGEEEREDAPGIGYAMGMGALGGGAVTGLAQMAGPNPFTAQRLGRDYFKVGAMDMSHARHMILSDTSLPSWKQMQLINELSAAERSGVQLDPQRLAGIGLSALAGWVVGRMAGFGGFGQAASAFAGGMVGNALFKPPSGTIIGQGFFRP